MIQNSKLREAQTHTDQNKSNTKYIQQNHKRKRRFSVIGRYGFRAMSPILEKDEDVHYTNKKRLIRENKVKEEIISATKPNIMRRRCTSHVQAQVNLNKSIELKFMNPAEGKIDFAKHTPENQKPRKAKWAKKLRRRRSGQQKTNTVLAIVPQMLSSKESLTTKRMNTISISLTKKEKENVNSSISTERNNFDNTGSDSRKNKNSLVAKHNVSSYSKTNKNSVVASDKKSHSNSLKQCRKFVNKSNFKCDSFNAIAQRCQMQQLRKTSSPKGHKKTSNDDDDQHKKKGTKLFCAKKKLQKTGSVSLTLPADTQNHNDVCKDTNRKKIEVECTLSTSRHTQIMTNNATNNLGLKLPHETCAQNVLSSETCQKQKNCKKSVFSLCSTTHSSSNLCNGDPLTKANSKINIANDSPKHSEKAFTENLHMKSYGFTEMRRDHSNLFNTKFNKSKFIAGTIVCNEDNILNDIITSNPLFRNSIRFEENHKLFPPKNSVINSDQTKQNLQYNNMSHKKSDVKVLKPLLPEDNSKAVINANTPTPLVLGDKFGSSSTPEKRRKRKVKNKSLATVKYYPHNLSKDNFPDNTSNAAWILPKSFPCDWLNTQDDIQLERKNSMMSCNIEVVPNSNNYKWRTWF